MTRNTDFPSHACVTDVRVRYAETDQMGFVYYANYPVWFEVGRASFMRDRGVPYGEWEAAGYILPISSVNYRLFSPAHYDDLVKVVTWVEQVRSRSVQFRYKILREGMLLAEGETVHICINPDRKPTSLPDHYRRAIDPRER
jgi:acyl-CoA thioester hydrolase